MCFSATASYSAAALLVTAGLYCLKQTVRGGAAYWMIALIPLFFGIQQAIEGRLWQLVGVGEAESVRRLALGFLFFSHFLWLLWIPLASYRLETEACRKGAFLAVTVIGALAGAAIYLPLHSIADWMSVEVRHHSIVYTVLMAHQDYLPDGLDRAIYAWIVLAPLLFSSHRHLRNLGKLFAVSLLLSVAIYDYAFISVWCFFAAVSSLYIIAMFKRLPLSAG